MLPWSVELSEYDNAFISKGGIKAQVLADFIIEPALENLEPHQDAWTLSVEGASNVKGSGAGITL